MGADIHLYAEARLKDGTWATVRSYHAVSLKEYDLRSAAERFGSGENYLFSIPAARNYAFFAALAGVRGHGPEARGLPPDVAPLTKHLYESWGSDAHTPSWLTAQEFLPIYLEHKVPPQERAELMAERLNSSYQTPLAEHLLEYHLNSREPFALNDIRFVFWFDN